MQMYQQYHVMVLFLVEFWVDFCKNVMGLVILSINRFSIAFQKENNHKYGCRNMVLLYIIISPTTSLNMQAAYKYTPWLCRKQCV